MWRFCASRPRRFPGGRGQNRYHAQRTPSNPANTNDAARGGRRGRGGVPSEGILDHIYARAIVIDNGATSAALVSVDTGMLGEQMWRTVSQRIEKELGIPAQNLIMNPTHTHSASGGSADQIFNVIKAAKEKLQPARIGYGTGVSYINVQRDIIDPRPTSGGKAPTTMVRRTRPWR